MRRHVAMLVTFTFCVAGALVPLAQRSPSPAARPGYLGDGVTLLPNGWRIAPAGRHVQIGDLPLNMVPSPDGRFLIITNNGWEKPTLSVFDTKSLQVVSRLAVNNAWLGLAWHPDGHRLFSSGASENVIYELEWANGRLKDETMEGAVLHKVYEVWAENQRSEAVVAGSAGSLVMPDS